MSELQQHQEQIHDTTQQQSSIGQKQPKQQQQVPPQTSSQSAQRKLEFGLHSPPIIQRQHSASLKASTTASTSSGTGGATMIRHRRVTTERSVLPLSADIAKNREFCKNIVKNNH